MAMLALEKYDFDLPHECWCVVVDVPEEIQEQFAEVGLRETGWEIPDRYRLYLFVTLDGVVELNRGYAGGVIDDVEKLLFDEYQEAIEAAAKASVRA